MNSGVQMPGPHWKPVAGAQIDRYATTLGGLSDDERTRVLKSASQILGHGPRADSDDPSRLGLALGYVQSGKTASFTALMATAADNGYRFVLAFLGSTTMLLDQNTERLRRDLGIESGSYEWLHLHKPRSEDLPRQVRGAVRNNKTVLVTVLKHPSDIDNLADILSRIPEIREHPSLVVDDEADQASLNTNIRNPDAQESSTYRAIRGLRGMLGQHLYVQYTATPFAPLLLDARNQLSPDFVENLQPGDDYTGGQTFFIDEAKMLLRAINDDEAEDKEPAQLPEGLRSALSDFIAGCALARASGAMTNEPMSMLVHPSHLKVVHTPYLRLVQAALEDWQLRLSRPAGDPGREADLDKLRRHAAGLVSHGAPAVDDAALVEALSRTIDEAYVWRVNSDGEARDLDWSRASVHILVGGNILERGYTVRGLTVTYLTRMASGTNNADTVEQRARNFGYKRSYLHYCRFYAPQRVLDAFRGLVGTEEDLRASLLDHVGNGRPLAEWSIDQGIALPAGLAPTRANVVAVSQRILGAGRWHQLRRPALDPTSVGEVERLVSRLGLDSADEVAFGRLSHRVREVRGAEIQEVLDVLAAWPVGENPTWDHRRLVDYLRRRHQQGHLEPVCLVLIEKDSRGEPRSRKSNAFGGGTANLLQGPDGGTGYPGDRGLGRELGVVAQVQVHRVRWLSGAGEKLLPDRERGVPTLALNVPHVSDFPDDLVLGAHV